MLWTEVDEDTLRQCEQAEKNCAARLIQPMPWFSLLIRMHRELERAGMLQRMEVEQEVCTGCVWGQDGCIQHYYAAHIDREVGKVLFCPNKTTQAMRDAQLALHKRRGRV